MGTRIVQTARPLTPSKAKLQTFLPYESFERTFECLDRARLGKQRVEAWQIWLTTQRSGGGWINHPAVRMWRGHEWWLLLYGLFACIEWRNRGYKDSMLPRFLELLENRAVDPYPDWIGSDALHQSHRSNLIRKDAIHYGKFGWNVVPTIGCHWPR